MTTAADIDAKNTEFQTAVSELDAARGAYEAAKAPYLEAKQSYIDAIAKVDALDDELEQLTLAYEPEAKPGDA